MAFGLYSLRDRIRQEAAEERESVALRRQAAIFRSWLRPRENAERLYVRTRILPSQLNPQGAQFNLAAARDDSLRPSNFRRHIERAAEEFRSQQLRAILSPRLRQSVRDVFGQLGDDQRRILSEHGITPESISVVPGDAAESRAPSAYYQGPREVVIGESTLKKYPSSLLHELGHQLLTIQFPRTGEVTGMGTQHVAMGLAGDVIEGEYSDVGFDPRKLEKSYQQVLEAFARGATWDEIKRARQHGSIEQIIKEKGILAGQGEIYRSGGAKTDIQDLLRRPYQQVGYPYGRPEDYPLVPPEYVEGLNDEIRNLFADQRLGPPSPPLGPPSPREQLLGLRDLDLRQLAAVQAVGDVAPKDPRGLREFVDKLGQDSFESSQLQRQVQDRFTQRMEEQSPAPLAGAVEAVARRSPFIQAAERQINPETATRFGGLSAAFTPIVPTEGLRNIPIAGDPLANAAGFLASPGGAAITLGTLGAIGPGLTASGFGGQVLGGSAANAGVEAGILPERIPLPFGQDIGTGTVGELLGGFATPGTFSRPGQLARQGILSRFRRPTAVEAVAPDLAASAPRAAEVAPQTSAIPTERVASAPSAGIPGEAVEGAQPFARPEPPGTEAFARESIARQAEPPVEPGAAPLADDAGRTAEQIAADAELEAAGLRPIRGGDPVARLTELIRAAKPIREVTERLKSEELGRRVAVGAKALESGSGESAFRTAKAQLRGQLPQAAFEPPRGELTTFEVNALYDVIREKEGLRFFDRIDGEEALTKVLAGQLPTRGEIKRIQDIFGIDLAEAILSKRPLSARLWENAVDLLNLPRSLLSAWDASAPLRQGLVLTVAHPKESIPNIRTMFKAMVSEKVAQSVDDAIRAGPYGDLKQQAGLYIAPRVGGAAELSAREETFMSSFAQKIPGIRQSERAYVTYLNKLRSDVFDTVARGWEGQNKSLQDFKDLARFLNHATGRGDLGPLRQMGPILNATFFSPRLVLSRLQLPVDLLVSTPSVRKLVARDLVATVGLGTAILSLMKMSNAAEVELDPRSSDFGKMRFGNQRIDFWGGFQPIARYVAQIASGQRKTLEGDIIGISREETFARFLRSKLAPVPAFIEDVRRGETFIGEELKADKATVAEQAFNRLTPLFIQDVIESAQQAGPVGAFRALPGALGINVQAYGNPLADAFNKKYPELAPYDPQVHGAIIDLDEELSALRGESDAQKRIAEGKEQFVEPLRTLAEGVRSGNEDAGRQFREEFSDFKKIMVGFTAREYLGNDFRDAKTPEGKALDAYYNLKADDFRDPATFEIDWGAFEDAQDRELAKLPEQVRTAIGNRLRLPPDLQDVERQYLQAQELRDQLGNISPIRNISTTTYDQLGRIWAEAERIKDAARPRPLPSEAAISQAAQRLGLRNLTGQAIAFRSGTRLREGARNPAYVNFIIQNETGLRPFYPELYQSNYILDIVNR